MNKELEELVERVYKMLCRSTFEKWYPADFVDHISGYDNCKSEEQIKKDLAKMLDPGW